MDNIDKFNEYYNKSIEIVKLYDRFVSLILIKNKDNINYKSIELIIKEIKEEIEKEYRLYDKLDLDDINRFIEIIHMKKDNGLKFADVRVNSQIAILYDKLLGNTILNLDMVSNIDEDLNFSLIDLISSKIAIDIYKLLDSKLEYISVMDDKSMEYADKIKDLNIQYVVYKLCLHEVSERLGIEYCYDIKKIPVISLDEIENNYFETFGINIDLKQKINSKVFRYLIAKVNEYKDMKMDMDNYESIYDNLLYVSQFEVLISYLTKTQLEFILAYFSRIKSDNKIVSSNIKKLVRNQINGI